MVEHISKQRDENEKAIVIVAILAMMSQAPGKAEAFGLCGQGLSKPAGNTGPPDNGTGFHGREADE